MDMQQKRIIAGVIFAVVCTLFFTQYTKPEQQEAIIVQEDSTKKPENSFLEPESNINELVVHVAGAVKNPGVYTLQEGDRIEDAITQAELLPEADADALNRAALLSDGQKIVVPFQQDLNSINQGSINQEVQYEETSTTVHTSEKVNLNTAAITQLMTLPGIGEVKAQAIIRYRQEHNGFKTIEELLQVNGIGTVIYGQIADLVCI